MVLFRAVVVATIGGNATDSKDFNVESFEALVVAEDCESETGVGMEADWITAEGIGGTFSLTADELALNLGIFNLSEPAKERRLRVRSSFGLASVIVTFCELFESEVGLDSDRVAPSLSRLEIVAVLLIEVELFIFAKLSFFFIGNTTPSPPSPNRENLGVGSVTDIQFSVGSREMEGGRG